MINIRLYVFFYDIFTVSLHCLFTLFLPFLRAHQHCVIRLRHINGTVKLCMIKTNKNTPSTQESSEPRTMSSSKIEVIATDTPKHLIISITGYRIIDMKILSNVFAHDVMLTV